MADLSTKYMGIDLSSPVIAGSGPMSRMVDKIKQVEEAGAGAIVIYSLFQEQMEKDIQEFEDALAYGSEQYAEALSYLPQVEGCAACEHVTWVEKTRSAVDFPLIGSLNAYSKGAWVDYARQLESAGCNAIELNVYSVETGTDITASDIEKRTLDAISDVKSTVKVPVSVKIGPWYTSVMNFIKSVEKTGADGIVLFNRFYQPIIDIDHESLKISLNLTSAEDTRLPLRWVAIASTETDMDISASTGIHTGTEVIQHILAGAKTTQTVSSVLKNGIKHITKMNDELAQWMDKKGYGKIEDFRGNVSKKKADDTHAFERAQYMKTLFSQK